MQNSKTMWESTASAMDTFGGSGRLGEVALKVSDQTEVSERPRLTASALKVWLRTDRQKHFQLSLGWMDVPVVCVSTATLKADTE